MCNIYVTIHACILFDEFIFVVCVHVILGLTILHKTIKNQAHHWQRLIFLQAFINFLFFFFQSQKTMKYSPFYNNMSILIAIVPVLFLKPLLGYNVSQISWHSGSYSLWPTLLRCFLSHRFRHCNEAILTVISFSTIY